MVIDIKPSRRLLMFFISKNPLITDIPILQITANRVNN